MKTTRGYLQLRDRARRGHRTGPRGGDLLLCTAPRLELLLWRGSERSTQKAAPFLTGGFLQQGQHGLRRAVRAVFSISEVCVKTSRSTEEATVRLLCHTMLHWVGIPDLTEAGGPALLKSQGLEQ